MADVFVGQSRDIPSVIAALKVPLSSLPDDVLSMFLTEAEAAQAVENNDHIVPIIDWGKSPPFIAFEFMSDGTLAQSIEAHRQSSIQFTEPELVVIFRQLVLGMSAINKRVIHRDLKPENIFNSSSGLRVGDFGIARFVGAATRNPTFKGWGTADYMAPETFKMESPDWRADQYSMGVIFFELATLHRPFIGDSRELEHAHLYKRPGLVTALREDLSDRVAQLIRRMLEKQPASRFASWDEVLEELVAIDERARNVVEADNSALLARAAADQLELARSRRLEAERIRDVRLSEIASRENLIKYWSEEFFSELEERISKINDSLGSEAVHVRRDVREANGLSSQGSRPQRLRCSARAEFLNASFVISLEALLPEDSGDFMGWGSYQLKTFNRLSVGNLILERGDSPYGKWLEITLRMSPMFRVNAPSGAGSSEYEVVGNERLVVAKNWPGLKYQWERRQTVSDVSYSESLFEFPSLLDTLLPPFFADAAVEPPALPRSGPDSGSGGMRRSLRI